MATLLLLGVAGFFQFSQAQEPQRVIGANGEVCYSLYGAYNCGGTYPYLNPFNSVGARFSVRLPEPGGSPLARGENLKGLPPSASLPLVGRAPAYAAGGGGTGGVPQTAGSPPAAGEGLPHQAGSPLPQGAGGATSEVSAPATAPAAGDGQAATTQTAGQAVGSPILGSEGRPRTAVAAPNMQIGAVGGYATTTDSDDVDSGIAFVTGKAAVPLGEDFGGQLDFALGTIGSDLTGIIGGHLFYRDPDVGLGGVILHYALGEDDPEDVSYLRPGVEAETYLGQAKIYGNAGYQFGSGGIEDGIFGGVRLDFYPVDTVALNIGGDWAVDDGSLSGGFEFMPGLEAAPGLSLTGQLSYGTSEFFTAFAGLRYSFGSEANLRIRDRYYDPPNLSLTGLQQILLGKANNDERGRRRGTGCAEGEYIPAGSETGECEPIPGCDPGFFFDTATGACVDGTGFCDSPDQVIVDGQCVSPDQCPPPNVVVGAVCSPPDNCPAPNMIVDGICVGAEMCDPPNVVVNGVCIPPDFCPPPNVIVNGECVSPVECPAPNVVIDGVCTAPDVCDPPNVIVDGLCVDPGECMPPNTIVDGVCTPPEVSCPPGSYIPSGSMSDVCVPYPDCPSGSFFQPDREECITGVGLCEPPDVYDPAIEACVSTGSFCPPGYSFDFTSYSCLYDPATVDCPPGQVVVNGFCAQPFECLPPNTVVGGICEGPSDGICPPGMFQNPDTGICEAEAPCPPGSISNGNGSCVPL